MVVKSMDSGLRLPEPSLAVYYLGDLTKVLDTLSLSFTVCKMGE